VLLAEQANEWIEWMNEWMNITVATLQWQRPDFLSLSNAGRALEQTKFILPSVLRGASCKRMSSLIVAPISHFATCLGEVVIRHWSITFMAVTIKLQLHYILPNTITITITSNYYQVNYNYITKLSITTAITITFSRVFANGNSPVNTPLSALLSAGTRTPMFIH